MIFKFNKYPGQKNCFAVWEKGFTDEELDKIIALEDLQGFMKGLVGDERDPANDIRDSDVSWIQPDENSHWIFERLASITAVVNQDHFMLNIDGLEALQYTKYGPEQHYTWHIDHEMGYTPWVRKISFVLALDSPDDYEGGELEIITTGNPDKSWKAKLKRGDIAYFASWMPHRVLPVQSGLRRSLVGWVMGERES